MSPADPVAGPAATARPGGQAPDDGGDWLAEATRQAAHDPAAGVPIDTRPRGDTHRGRARESKRGQR